MNWQETPVFVTNRNNLDRGFRRLTWWLTHVLGMTNVIVLDNLSSYAPLLEFYVASDLKVRYLGRNCGPHALWEIGAVPTDTRFIVTDPDVVPAPDCPPLLVRRMHEVFDAYPNAFKVGPSLRIDNLPVHYVKRAEVLAWEQQFWGGSRGDCFPAGIDTTFALYAPGSGPGSSSWDVQAEHLRLIPPYTFEHVPWYEDSSKPSDELIHYRANAEKKWIHW